MADAPRNVVFLASYPKSGNTWVRFMLCNLLFGRQESAAEMSRMIPDIHEIKPIPEAVDRRVIFKTHFAYHPAMPLANSILGAVYIVRNPLDTLASNFDYRARKMDLNNADLPTAFSAYVNEFIADGGDPTWRARGYGRWVEHVESWTTTALPFPVLVVRYEDMLQDAQPAAERIAWFLKLPKTADEIKQAVEASTFARMRAIEDEDIRLNRVGIFYKPYLAPRADRGWRFMREGRAGRAPAALSDEQMEQFARVFGPTMKALGYVVAASN